MSGLVIRITYLSYLWQHVDEACGQEDSSSVTKKDWRDGSFPEMSSASSRIRRLDQGSELERKKSEEKWNSAKQGHSNHLRYDYVHFGYIRIK